MTDGKQRQKVAGKYSEEKEFKISALFAEFRVFIRERRGGGQGLRRGRKVVNSFLVLEVEKGICNGKGYFWQLR